jgi:hypothetical protein
VQYRTLTACVHQLLRTVWQECTCGATGGGTGLVTGDGCKGVCQLQLHSAQGTRWGHRLAAADVRVCSWAGGIDCIMLNSFDQSVVCAWLL